MASRGVNKVILVGNVGQDPETRYMPNGNAVTNITLATSESWKDRNTGEQQERTEWHRITFYQRLAEIVAEYVRKGSKLYVEGRLQTRSWEQDGIKRYATDIIANEMQMLDSRNSGGGDYGGSHSGGDFGGSSGAYGGGNQGGQGNYGGGQAGNYGGGQQGRAPSSGGQAARPANNPAPQNRPADDFSMDDDIPF